MASFNLTRKLGELGKGHPSVVLTKALSSTKKRLRYFWTWSGSSCFTDNKRTSLVITSTHTDSGTYIFFPKINLKRHKRRLHIYLSFLNKPVHLMSLLRQPEYIGFKATLTLGLSSDLEIRRWLCFLPARLSTCLLLAVSGSPWLYGRTACSPSSVPCRGFIWYLWSRCVKYPLWDIRLCFRMTWRAHSHTSHSGWSGNSFSLPVSHTDFQSQSLWMAHSHSNCNHYLPDTEMEPVSAVTGVNI